jgi:hypothetical protein
LYRWEDKEVLQEMWLSGSDNMIDILQVLNFIVQIFIYMIIVDIYLKLRNIGAPDEEERAYNSWYGRKR